MLGQYSRLWALIELRVRNARLIRVFETAQTPWISQSSDLYQDKVE